MARRSKKTEEQMKLFDEGGLKDEGGTVDPVSGNDVPAGSTQAEVRDDIPAQLSEGEFVFPADVVRYIGLENLMELRAKAKRGLAKMEAMGQMGNADEATMDDSGEYDGEIDELIDNFDPNDPETMSFAEGGVVYAQQGAFVPGMPQQQFSYGYMPPQQQGGYQAPQVPTTQFPDYSQFVSRPAQQAVGEQKGVTEQRQYIGPNGEMITIMFMDGKPQQEIPAGYKVYKPEEQKTPEVAQPVVSQPDGGGGDDRERQEQAEADYKNWTSTMEDLAQLSAGVAPEFAKSWGESQHNPKNGFDLGDFIAGGAVAGALANDVSMAKDSRAALEAAAEKYGLDPKDYENKFTFFGLDKYDEARFVEDAKKARDKQVADLRASVKASDVARRAAMTEEERKAADEARESQMAANKAQTEQRAAAIRESDGGGGDGGPDNAGGTTDSYSGGRDADGWGE